MRPRFLDELAGALAGRRETSRATRGQAAVVSEAVDRAPDAIALGRGDPRVGSRLRDLHRPRDVDDRRRHGRIRRAQRDSSVPTAFAGAELIVGDVVGRASGRRLDAGDPAEGHDRGEHDVGLGTRNGLRDDTVSAGQRRRDGGRGQTKAPRDRRDQAQLGRRRRSARAHHVNVEAWVVAHREADYRKNLTPSSRRPRWLQVRSKMGEVTAKTKSSSGAILRRRRSPVAAFRRDRRGEDPARAIPDWGRIVLRSGATTLR